MREQDFLPSAPGQLVKNLNGDLAFIPHRLPGRIAWTDQLVNAISEAEAALGRLSGLGRKFPKPQRLIRLFLRREAELSSRIENTHAGVRTQLLFKYLPDVKKDSPDVVEVENNFRALDFAMKAIKSRPISQHLIREMHHILLQNVRGEEMTPGEYRQVQAHIGTTDNIHDARFVPTPPHAIRDCMEQLESFITGESDTPRIAKLGMMHYQFEAIHPFADGNGRIGRVLILLMMCKMGMLPLPLFNPSAYLERNRRQYHDLLLEVSQRGDWSAWIAFFARGITEECLNTNKLIVQLEELRNRYHDKLRSSRSSAKLAELVDELFGRPRIKLDEAAKLLDVWPKSAQRFIDRLLSLGILREVTGRQRNRIYLAHEIVSKFATRHTER